MNIMAAEQLKILLLEDMATDAELAMRELNRAGLPCVAKWVVSKEDFCRELEEFSPDVVLSDFSMPELNGLEALSILRQQCPETPFIFVSGTMGEEFAVESLKRGATDYILKADLTRLSPSITRAIEEKQERHARQTAEQLLRESELRKGAILNGALDCILSVDADLRIIEFNPAAEKVFGYDQAEVVGKDVIELVFPPEIRDAQRKRFSHYHEGDEHGVLEGWVEVNGIRRDGSQFPMEFAATPILMPSKTLFSIYIRDIVERKKQEEKIKRLTRLYAVLSNINSTIVRVHEPMDLFSEVCRIVVEYGKFKMAWIGLIDGSGTYVEPVASYGVEKDMPPLEKIFIDNAISKEAEGISKVVCDDEIIIVNDIASSDILHKDRLLQLGYKSLVKLPLHSEEQLVGVIALYRNEQAVIGDDEMKLLLELSGDISFALDVIAKEKKIDYLAYYDPLTGLANRTLFFERATQNLHHAKQKNKLVAVLAADLDGFKNVNDTLGWQSGDELLKQVTRRLSDMVVEHERLARIGADRFALIIDTEQETEAARVLEKNIANLNRPYQVSGHELRIGCKTGVAFFPNDGADAETVFKNAEAALKKAKTTGEQYLFYAPAMNAKVSGRLSLENKLRQALELQQFVLYYQPKVSLKTGKITGLEALIRWDCPGSGLVPPGEYIWILEENGMILDVGRWALEKASVDQEYLRNNGHPQLRIAVNVSPKQLHHKDFVEDITRVVKKSGGLSGLDLEITETMIMQDVEDCIEKLKIVKDMGFKIAIDDFGTGYSSLSYIARLPVSALKIDRSFVCNMTSDPNHLAIVSTVISLAHALNLEVIAEGVEEQEQENLLRLLKCDEMQGYIFSPAVPIGTIETMLAAQVDAE